MTEPASLPDPQALAVTVRDALHHRGAPFGPGSLDAYLAYRDNAEAALASLVALADGAAQAEQELRYTHDRGDHLVYFDEWKRFDEWQRGRAKETSAAEQRVAALEAALEAALNNP